MEKRDEIPDIVTQDRSDICDIISEMLDNPDKHGIYQTTIAYNKLEDLMRDIRKETIEWLFNEICEFNFSDVIEKSQAELNPEWKGK